MAKEPETVGSDRAELKRHLKLAANKPIHMAFCVGGDGKAVIQMEKLKPPRTIEKMLKDGLPDSKNHRFGTVTVSDDAPDTAVFMVNKPVGGFARKLTIALKGTGFRKIKIVTEDGTPVEEHEDEDDEEEAASPEPRVAADDGEGGGSRRTEADVGAEKGLAPGDWPDDGPKPDAAALTKKLTGLVKAMMAVIKNDPTQKSALAELATDAQSSLKRGDMEQAAAGIEILRLAIGSAGGDAPADAPSDDAPAELPGDGGLEIDVQVEAGDQEGATDEPETVGALPPRHTSAGKAHAKARTAWLATRAKMTGDLDGLTDKFSHAFKDHGQAGDLQKAFKARLDSVLGELDEQLAQKLDEINQAEDGIAHAKIVQEAQKILVRYQATVATHPTIKALDQNPFVQINLEKTLTTTLGTLSKVLR